MHQGEFKVIIDRFLSEGKGYVSTDMLWLTERLGGFAHVYLVRSSAPIPANSDQCLHVLKRLAVPDKDQLQHVRKEVDIMVSLKPTSEPA